MQQIKNPPASPQDILYGHLRELKHCDILIDRMAGYPLQDEVKELDPKLVQFCTLLDPIFADSPEQAPLLVRLPHSESELIEKFLEHALAVSRDPNIETRAICAFLFSPLEQATLGKRLTRQLNAKVQSFGNIYFRYFDPRVTHHLPRILSAEQLAGILHGVQRWGYVSWTGQFNVIQEPSVTEFPSLPAFTSRQWEAMERIEAINTSLRMLRSVGVILNDESDLRIEAQLVKAKSAGLLTASDLATYAAYSIKFGAEFTQHPDLNKYIGFVGDSETPFADILEQRTGSTLQSDTFYKTPGQRATA